MDSSISSKLFFLLKLFYLSLCQGISLGMLEFEFIITMVIVANCLQLTIDLTDELQKVCYDSTSVREKVRVICCTIPIKTATECVVYTKCCRKQLHNQ